VMDYQSDPLILRDFFEGEYNTNVEPASYAEVSQLWPNYTLDMMVQPQVVNYFETVERLPEFLVESKQQKIFNSPIEYTSQSSVVNFERKYADTTYFRDPSDTSWTGGDALPVPRHNVRVNFLFMDGHDETRRNSSIGWSLARTDPGALWARDHSSINRP